MNWETIIVAGIAFLGTLIGSYMTGNKTVALLSYRIDQIEKKVEKHNCIVERTYKLEKDVNTAFLKIDDLKSKIDETKGKR